MSTFKFIKINDAKFDLGSCFAGIDSNGELIFAYYEDGLSEDKLGVVNEPRCQVQSLAEMSGFDLELLGRELSFYELEVPSYVEYDGKILGSFFRIREGRSEDRYFAPLVIGGENNGKIKCSCSYSTRASTQATVTCPHLEGKLLEINPCQHDVDMGQNHYCYFVKR